MAVVGTFVVDVSRRLLLVVQIELVQGESRGGLLGDERKP